MKRIYKGRILLSTQTSVLRRNNCVIIHLEISPSVPTAVRSNHQHPSLFPTNCLIFSNYHGNHTICIFHFTRGERVRSTRTLHSNFLLLIKLGLHLNRYLSVTVSRNWAHHKWKIPFIQNISSSTLTRVHAVIKICQLWCSHCQRLQCVWDWGKALEIILS